MAKENISTGVMFADVIGSTKLYEALGDENANRVIGKVLGLMAEITGQFSGHVIKTIGDEIMCRFPSADDMVRAAVECQEEISAGIRGVDVEVSIKVGLHFGPAILSEDGDVFGDAVNVAARMAGIANSAQIITTRETVLMLQDDLQEKCRRFDKTMVKGKEEEIVVHQVVWESGSDVTRIMMVADVVKEQTKFLSLEFQGSTTRLSSAELGTFVLGRGIQSDLVCKARLASRTHATVEFRRGKFLLTDQSSNGTFLRTEDGENIFLRRQELPLWGAGTMALGEEFASDEADNIIRYVCE
jgi:adenylate cyclase